MDDITFDYGPIGGADPIGLTVGAENRDGSSGSQLESAPTEGQQSQHAQLEVTRRTR